MAEALDPPSVPASDRKVCRIVFVCTGNTCRSPMAEAICKKRLADRLGCAVEELPARGFLVQSAGLAAGEGLPAAPEAVAVAAALGVDLSRHESRLLSPELAEQADRIVHVVALGAEQTRLHRKVIPHRQHVAQGHAQQVVGLPLEAYQECARQMAGYIDHLVAEVAPSSPASPDAR